MSEKKKKEYKYFVSYFISKDNFIQAWGRAEIIRNEKIKSIKDIFEIEKELCEKDNFKQVLILNYVLM